MTTKTRRSRNPGKKHDSNSISFKYLSTNRARYNTVALKLGLGQPFPTTLIALEKTFSFESTLHDWHEADKIYANFKTHFQSENNDRLKKLTVQSAGYHGAYEATKFSQQLQPLKLIWQLQLLPPLHSTKMWHAAGCTTKQHHHCIIVRQLHGLSKNLAHTSAHVQQPSPQKQQRSYS